MTDEINNTNKLDKEIRKLKRSELLEILYSLRKELDSVQAENNELKKQLAEQKSAADVCNEILDLVRQTNSIVKGENPADNENKDNILPKTEIVNE